MSIIQIITIKQGIKMHLATGGRMQITSTAKGGGIKHLLALATSYTGQLYKLNDESKRAALADLQAILDAVDEGDAAVARVREENEARAKANGLTG